MNIYKAKLYAKVTAVALLFLLVVIFLLQNSKEVSIKFLFWESPRVPMFMFVVSVAAAGVLIFKVSTRIGRLITDVRQVKREEKARQDMVAKTKKDIDEKAGSS